MLAGDFCSPLFSNCRFTGNVGESGGGIFCGGYAWATFRSCTFDGNAAVGASGLGGGIHCAHESDVEMTECTLTENIAESGGGALYSDWVSQPLLARCTLVGNAAPLGSGLYCDVVSIPRLGNCIIAFGAEGEAVYSADGTGPIVQCCDVYGNAGGDWVGVIADQLGENGNFSADPLFCARLDGDLHLNADSPCLPGVNPACGLIGAWPIGCPSTGIADQEAIAGILLRLKPNPLIAGTRIELRLPSEVAGERLRLVILDSTGRVVREFDEGGAQGGGTTVYWDRRDGAGLLVPSGLYLCRLEVGARQALRKAVILD